MRDMAAAQVFSALGDGTRLSMLRRLSTTGALSATSLAEGAKVSRQAIVKHLQVLEGAGLVNHERRGREVLFSLNAERMGIAKAFLDSVSARWDEALDRLRAMVEIPEPLPPRRRHARQRRH